MTHSPRKQNSNQHGLYLLAAEQFNFRLRSVDIYLYLLEIKCFIARHILNLIRQVLHSLLHRALLEIVAHNTIIFFTFTSDGVLFDLLIDRNIVTQQTPNNATYLGDT